MKLKIRNLYLSIMITIVAFSGVLTGCGVREPKTLLETENIVVTRSGKHTSVEDVQGDQVYNFTLKRVEKDAQESHKVKESNESKCLKITLAGKVIVIEDKLTGETYYF